MAKKPSKQANPVEELRYEELIEQLEAIVDRIESGEAGLEESIKGYEEGVSLVKRARQILDQAEQRVVELSIDEIDAQDDPES